MRSGILKLAARCSSGTLEYAGSRWGEYGMDFVITEGLHGCIEFLFSGMLLLVGTIYFEYEIWDASVENLNLEFENGYFRGFGTLILGFSTVSIGSGCE